MDIHSVKSTAVRTVTVSGMVPTLVKTVPYGRTTNAL